MMMCFNKFCVGVNQSALLNGIVIPQMIDFSSVPHLIIVAPSGSGKTYLLKFLLKQIAKMPVLLILADFKGIDFIQMSGCKHYYKHTEVATALDFVFNEMQERMAKPKAGNQPIYFCIDEWSGFLSLHTKKEQDEFKQKMASILMLGRGVQVFVIMSLQRADTTYITGRDNFGNAIGLGALSKESVRMLFADEADLIKPKPRGKGYLRIDGKPLCEIVVPEIKDMNSTEMIIKKALSEN